MTAIYAELAERIRSELSDLDRVVNLDEFRRFRHIVRNIYVINLAPDKMAGLIAVLPGLWSRLQDELMAFADFLEKLATAGKGTGKEGGSYS